MAKSWKDYVPEQLQSSNTFYVVITDLKGNYVYASELFRERFSFIANDFIGLPFETTIHRDDVEPCNAVAWTCMQDLSAHVPITVRKPVRDYTGFYLTQWEFSAIAENGAPIGLFCLGYDITESTKNSRDVRRFANKLTNIIDNISDGLFIIDESWCFLTINKAAEKILNRERGSTLGRSIWEVFPRFREYEHLDYFINAMREQSRQSFEDYRESVNTYLQVTIYPSVEGLTVLLRDVSEAQRLQSYLWESRTKLRAILDSTNEANMLIGLDYKLRSFNKSAERYLTAYLGREPRTGDDFRGYVKESLAAYFFQDFEKAVRGETAVQEEAFRLNPDEPKRWFRLAYHPAYDETDSLLGISLTAMDIDKEKRAQKRILKQNENLRSIAHLQSHEVRRPLANLIGLLQIFETNNLDEQQIELIELLRASIEELDTIVSKIVNTAEEVEKQSP